MENVLFGALIAFVIVVAFTLFKSSQLQRIESKDHEDLAAANRKIGDLEHRIFEYTKALDTNLEQYRDLSKRFDELRHQKISADVKLGAKAENLLPFLETFPYKDDEIRGLFNPIDLIVFRDDEVVFVEVKSGQSQLSEKQRQIRDNIKANRVRFEVHRMDEKGVKIK